MVGSLVKSLIGHRLVWQTAGLARSSRSLSPPRSKKAARLTTKCAQGGMGRPADLAGYMQRVKDCNSDPSLRNLLLPFVIGRHHVGYVHQRFAERLRPFSDVFVVEDGRRSGGGSSDQSSGRQHQTTNSGVHDAPGTDSPPQRAHHQGGGEAASVAASRDSRGEQAGGEAQDVTGAGGRHGTGGPVSAGGGNSASSGGLQNSATRGAPKTAGVVAEKQAAKGTATPSQPLPSLPPSTPAHRGGVLSESVPLPYLSLHPALVDQGLDARNTAVDRVLRALAEQGVIAGWRDELYPVGVDYNSPPELLVERASAPFFGIKAYGVHVNGYVEKGDGSKLLWVARRSPDKPTWPNLLDHIAAGGQPHGISCRANVIKEAEEEAGIPPHLAERAVSVGALTYEVIGDETLKRDVLFLYDLRLPADFVPHNMDGEVAEFLLMPVEEVAEIIRTTRQYKPNCSLVIIDFLIRHGYITPDQPGYLELVKGLHP